MADLVGGKLAGSLASFFVGSQLSEQAAASGGDLVGQEAHPGLAPFQIALQDGAAFAATDPLFPGLINADHNFCSIMPGWGAWDCSALLTGIELTGMEDGPSFQRYLDEDTDSAADWGAPMTATFGELNAPR